MSPRISRTLEGISSKGRFGRKEVLWRDVGGVRLEGDGTLLVFYQPKPEARVPWVDSIEVPPGETASTLLFPSFPRWLLPGNQVASLRNPSISPQDFGPPADTRWVRRAVPPSAPEVELWSAGLGRFRGFAPVTVRVGLFHQGAAFELASAAMEVYPWRLVRLFLTRGHILANWVQGPKEAAGLGEDNELDPGQAHALVRYPSGRAWELSAEIREVIGLDKA